MANRPPARVHSIRRYTLADHTRLAHICANVYRGTDTLPYAIKTQWHHKPSATVLVAVGDDNAVNGVVCAEERGPSASFLFGLRVAEEARGSGLAKQLMAHVCRTAAQPRHIRQLLTTTIPQNAAALRVLTGLGFTHSHTVDRWPQEPRQFAYEAAVGFQPNADPEQPVVSAPGQLHMLDHLPGARQLISELTAAQGVQPGHWMCCSDVAQLQEAVASIRAAQQQQQQQQHVGTAAGAACQGGDWLPWVYEVFPLQSHWVAERIAARQVWLLPSSSGQRSSNGGYAAAAVLAHSSLNSRTCAGVLAADEGAVAAALDWAGSRAAHFVAYVDRGHPHSSGAPDPHLALPPVLQLGSSGEAAEHQYSCYLVLGRDAAGAGAGAGLPKL